MLRSVRRIGALLRLRGMVLALTLGLLTLPLAPFGWTAPAWSLTPPEAAERLLTLHRIDASGTHEPLGTLLLEDTAEGLRIVPDLQGLPPGEHGFHLHALGSCDPGNGDDGPVAGLAAGGHWDPDGSGHHLGPDGPGHRGDLSRLVVGADGHALAPVRAPRLTVADVSGKALIVHAGGDTYTDTPPLGGGGARVACASA